MMDMVMSTSTDNDPNHPNHDEGPAKGPRLASILIYL
jgi:hypothetical protein